MADRLSAEIPRLAKLTTSSAVDMTRIESLSNPDDVSILIERIREAVRWTVHVATPNGKSSDHSFETEDGAAAFVAGFAACAKLRRRGPRKKGEGK